MDLHNEYAQEQGIMDLDPAHEMNGPLTPSSPGMDKHDELRMSVDEDDIPKSKYSGGVRELTPAEADSDGSHQEQEKEVSADDFEAMKAIALESPGDLETVAESYYTWEIRNYSKLGDRVLSPEFECGGYKWRVLFFPWGNNQKECSSAYIEAIPPPDAPSDWYVCAQFAIVIYNPTNPKKHREIAASHRFYAHETDWGFTQYLNIRQSYQRSAHTNETPIAKGGNDTNITVYVRVVKDPTGVLWHNYRDYDSRRMTGYAGLRNQGATCYMNSLLQSLYFTNAFRKIVYKIPTEGEDPTKSLTLALQRVFIQLQSSPDPVSTIGLTQSFGWDSFESFVQHDAQEFERILLEGLEKKMKEVEKITVLGAESTADKMLVDGATGASRTTPGSLFDELKRLFCGRMESYVKCVNVNYESRRGEEYWDIQLNVKGFKNLRESFENLVAVEMMEGDNQYRAEGHGLQDAQKGVLFQSFPPVLHMQLKRFEYDFNRDMIVKINDRYEYPLEIDLSDFLAPSADRSVSYNYKLHGVLVHSGDVHGGHYYGMIKPEKNSKWFRYDDERVIPVTTDDVLEENFGGDGGINSFSQNGMLTPQTRIARNQAQWKRFTSAYMLVYLREDAISEILAPITPQDIPQHVVQRVEEERLEAIRKRREKEEMHLYISIKMIDLNTFRHHEGIDLASFDPQDKEAQEYVRSYRVRRDLTWLGLYQHVAEAYSVGRDHIRLWHLVNRQNKTIRPDVPIPADHSLTIESWMKNSSARGPDLRLYMEMAEDIWHPTVPVLPKRTLPTPQPPFTSPPRPSEEFKDPKELSHTSSGHSHSSSRSLLNGDIELETSNGEDSIEWPEVGKLPGVYNARHDAAMIMIFLKWFDVDNQRLRGVRPIYVNRHDKTGKLTPVVAEMMDWKQEPGEPPVTIAFYEEIKPGMTEPLKPNATFIASEIQDGDIICYMRTLPSKRVDELLREGKHPDPIRYYEFLFNKITLKFLPRFSDQTVKEEFSCTLSKNMKYDQVAAKIAEHLNVQATHLRFSSATSDGRPRNLSIKRTGPLSTVQQFTTHGGMPLPPIVFYEVLELSLADMESKREVTITWLPDGVATMEPVTLLVSRQATFEEVIQALVKKHTSIPSEIHNRIRLFDVRGNKDYREFQLTQALSTASLDTSYGTNFYAEAIPPEEDEMGEQDRFAIVVHFAKELTRLHGVAVKFVIKPRELWYDTKKRLQKRLGYKDKDYSKIKFFIITDPYAYISKQIPLDDGLSRIPSHSLLVFEVIYDRLSDKQGKESIGLDHPDRSPNRKGIFSEKALTIKS